MISINITAGDYYTYIDKSGATIRSGPSHQIVGLTPGLRRLIHDEIVAAVREVLAEKSEDGEAGD